MPWLRRLSPKLIEAETRDHSSSEQNLQAMPTVRFDPATASNQVKMDLRRNIESLGEVDKKDSKPVYEAALRCVLAGGDLHVLTAALRKIEGMPQGRASEIARSLNRKAKAQLDRDRQASLGITQAIWMYANAPCMNNASLPTLTEVQQDSAHCAANGKIYEVGKGFLINGKWTWPGVEEGCKCTSKSVLPGLCK